MLSEHEDREALKKGYIQLIERKSIIIFLLAIGIIVLSGIAATLGSADISPIEVYVSILSHFFPQQFHSTEYIDTIIWHLRLHRILMAIFAGMGLAIAGSIMQGILKNPLASPFTLGISSAASFGASLAIIFGVGFMANQYMIVANAFIFTMLASMIVYGLAKYKGISSETMIMAGIAIMYLFSAMTSLLQYFGDSEAVQEVVFWMMGSLSRSSWDNVWIVSLVTVICMILAMKFSWNINILSAGDETASSLGINVELTRVIGMMVASLVTASITCFTGTIGFIGLVAPHITRMIIGNDYRFLIPTSALIGSLLLLVADTVGRSIIAPVILPVGIMTAFMGVPFFIYLFLKRRKGFW